jgi:hypothetical protein
MEPSAATHRATVMGKTLRNTLLLVSLPVLLGSGRDPGILLELDRSAFELTARDLRGRAVGPRIPVAVGSPRHPTPAGEFPLYRVIETPAWRPGPEARSAGAQPVSASSGGPLGVAKIPFARGGIALHGGAHPLLLGKPISLGCVRTEDADLLGLLDWLDARGALGPPRQHANGEAHRAFLRPARIRVR